MHRFESILNCQLMKIPFVYLGIPMGANCKRISTWKSVLDKFSKKLVSLKRFLLSFFRLNSLGYLSISLFLCKSFYFYATF